MGNYLGNKKAIALFILPLLIIYCAMVVFPAAQTFGMSFTDWDGLSRINFVGLKNYRKLMESKEFWISFQNGLKYPILVATYQIVVASLLANILINKSTKGASFFRTSYFIPVILSMTVVCQLWINIYQADFGLLNMLFEKWGWSYRQYWLSDAKSALFAVAFVDAWKGMGYHFLIIYAGLKSIPESYTEAAWIDGANAWQRFWKVTVPCMAPTYKVTLTLTLTWGFRTFQNINIMTGGGPGKSTYTMPILIYKQIYQLGNYGAASSSSAVLLLECLIVIKILERAFKNTMAD
jgi:raffinose/stachyose/melibiose transport system permease protein